MPTVDFNRSGYFSVSLNTVTDQWEVDAVFFFYIDHLILFNLCI